MMSVPELIVARSIPRLVQDSAHHLYCSCSAWTPKAMLTAYDLKLTST